MKRHALGLLMIAILGLLCASVWVDAQFGFGRRVFIQQNDPPPTELIVARWSFNINGLIGHTGNFVMYAMTH